MQMVILYMLRYYDRLLIELKLKYLSTEYGVVKNKIPTILERLELYNINSSTIAVEGYKQNYRTLALMDSARAFSVSVRYMTSFTVSGLLPPRPLLSMARYFLQQLGDNRLQTRKWSIASFDSWWLSCFYTRYATRQTSCLLLLLCLTLCIWLNFYRTA